MFQTALNGKSQSKETQMNRALRQITVIAFLVICIIQVASAGRLEYPETQRIGHVDLYHGIEVIDTYRWLEEDVRESERVREWVNAQNKVTFEYLQSLPRREQIKKRLTELWDYEKYSIPGKAGGRYYITKNDGLQNHHVIYVMIHWTDSDGSFSIPTSGQRMGLRL